MDSDSQHSSVNVDDLTRDLEGEEAIPQIIDADLMLGDLASLENLNLDLDNNNEDNETFDSFDDYDKQQNKEETVGGYSIREVIGRGGFATVHKGINIETGHVVAVKKIDKSALSTDQVASVFREVILLTRLQHPHIVKMFGRDENSKHLYIFIEYMESGSLFGIISHFGVFPEPLIALYIEQVLHGLIYLHEQGVVHRDIKAANILLNNEWVKLADFGVASEINENDKRFSVVGTPYWMAPEVIEIAGHSFASDIWSLGCTIIELYVGHPPYWELNPMSAMFKIVSDTFPPFPKNISPSLKDFLESCFQKLPEQRATAKELLSHEWLRIHKNDNQNTVVTDLTTITETLKQFNNKAPDENSSTVLHPTESFPTSIQNKDTRSSDYNDDNDFDEKSGTVIFSKPTVNEEARQSDMSDSSFATSEADSQSISVAEREIERLHFELEKTQAILKMALVMARDYIDLAEGVSTTPNAAIIMNSLKAKIIDEHSKWVLCAEKGEGEKQRLTTVKKKVVKKEKEKTEKDEKKKEKKDKKDKEGKKAKKEKGEKEEKDRDKEKEKEKKEEKEKEKKEDKDKDKDKDKESKKSFLTFGRSRKESIGNVSAPFSPPTPQNSPGTNTVISPTPHRKKSIVEGLGFFHPPAHLKDMKLQETKQEDTLPISSPIATITTTLNKDKDENETKSIGEKPKLPKTVSATLTLRGGNIVIPNKKSSSESVV